MSGVCPPPPNSGFAGVNFHIVSFFHFSMFYFSLLISLFLILLFHVVECWRFDTIINVVVTPTCLLLVPFFQILFFDQVVDVPVVKSVSVPLKCSLCPNF